MTSFCPSKWLSANLIGAVEFYVDQNGPVREKGSMEWEKRGFVDQATSKLFNREGILDRFTNEATDIVNRVRAIAAGLADLGL